MISSLFAIVTLAVLNATLPEQAFPVDVDIGVPSGDAAAATTATATPVLDATLMGSIIALATGLFAAFRRNAAKVDAVADSTVNVKESLKATDYGNKDTAQILANALTKLSQVKSIEEIPQALAECAPAAKENAKEWQTDVKEYYEVKPPITSADLGLDKTRQKLVDVNKETQRTTAGA